MDEVGDTLALHQKNLVPKSSCEDSMLYRCRLGERGMLRFIDDGIGEQKVLDVLVSLEKIHEDDLVVARLREVDGLYWRKVLSINDKGATVLLMDYGMKEEVPTTKLWKLLGQFDEHLAMDVKVRVEHIEVFEDSLENRD